MLTRLKEVDAPPTAIEAAEAAELPDGEDETGEELSNDTVFGILKNSRRREVLRYLKAHDRTATVREVTERIAAIENGIEEAEVSYKQRKRVYVSFYQCHLPKMAKAGVIDYNKDRGWIKLRPVAAQMDEYLEDQRLVAENWSHYLTVTTLGGLLYVFGTLLVGPGSWFTSLTVVGLIGSVTGLALIDARHSLTRRASPESQGLLDRVSRASRGELQTLSAVSDSNETSTSH